MSDPSVTVAEAFKQFSQTTVSALRAYEHGTRSRLNQAEDDLRTLRHERDDALRDFNACKEQSRAWAAEVDRWKAEADRALVVNQHQADLVAQLRQEAQQWKDQCLRLEETLRGEIKAWKDQFLRIDAEHTRLLNELSSAPSSSSQVTLTTHTPRHVPIIAAASGDSSATSSATKRGPSASSSTARADNKLAYPSPTTARSFPRVIRRVNAVIDVPIKEEEEEDGGDASFERPDPTVLQPTSTPASTARASGGSRARGGAGAGTVGGDTRRRKSSASSHHQRSVVPPSDEGSYIDEEDPPSDDADGGEYVDEEEVENAIVNGTPVDAVAGGGGGGVGGRKTAPWGRKHVRHEPDEEDDELMMYAKDNPHKVRTPYENHQLRRPPLRKNVADAAAQRLSATNPSAQKRRTTETGSGGAVRTKRRR